ncbi:purple acid phosphatase family protein [Rhodotorula paludigena]|uniref:purple acid phosphatase family protein n=1 Tax=Rhodotorula paludigena TaxID=86838 RepID=UPI00317D0562
MLASLLAAGAAASLASSVLAAEIPAANTFKCGATDLGNGVHVPGAIPKNLKEPLQHRLAYAGADGMTISWSSFTKWDEPTVWYGERPDKLNQVKSSDLCSTYPTSRTYNCHVKLHGLKPNTKYYYKVSGTNGYEAAYLPTYTFTTAREAGDESPYTIATFGDLGLMGEDGLSDATGPFGGSEHAVLDSNETNTIQSLLALADTYDFMYHVGDIGYADYALKQFVQGYWGTGNETTQPTRQDVADHYECMSEQFFDQMRPVTAQKPWMVLPGNHEANCDNGGVTDKRADIVYTDDWCLPGQTNFSWFIEHYKMPSYESEGRSNFWYSFDSGMVHYISLTSETDLGEGLVGPIENSTNNHNGPFGRPNEQVDWLKADLAKVDRSKTPWVLAHIHRPWLTNVNGDEPHVYTAWQQAFENILYEGEVDAVMHGHVHTYEVFAPQYNGTVDENGLNNPRAPLYIINGAAGHYDGLDEFPSEYRDPSTIYATDQEMGWGRMTFHNRTHMTYEYVASRNSSVINSNTLYKAHEYDSDKHKRSSWCGKFKC